MKKILLVEDDALLNKTLTYNLISGGGGTKDFYDDGRLFLDFSEQSAALNGKSHTLSPMEYKMLYLFCKNPKQILTRQRLLERLWDAEENYVDEHTLTTSISRSRGKIEAETLFNLLDNAVKYTPAGGAICVSAVQWEMYWDLSWRFVGNIPYLRQHFKPYCMQTAGYDEPLHYSETAMDISAGPGGCVGGHIFDFFCICQVRTKENKHIVCNQR